MVSLPWLDRLTTAPISGLHCVDAHCKQPDTDLNSRCSRGVNSGGLEVLPLGSLAESKPLMNLATVIFSFQRLFSSWWRCNSLPLNVTTLFARSWKEPQAKASLTSWML